jgi:hypothetical protein
MKSFIWGKKNLMIYFVRAVNQKIIKNFYQHSVPRLETHMDLAAIRVQPALAMCLHTEDVQPECAD